MFVLKRANTPCRQQMTTVNLLQKQFKQLLLYTVLNWYYISIPLGIFLRGFSGDAVWLLDKIINIRHNCAFQEN